MLKGEHQVELATLRMRLRAIDAEIAVVREESRRYRQMRFGLDLKEIQLTGLQDQRDACKARLGQLGGRNRGRRTRRDHPLAWLLLPIALLLRARRSLAPMREQPTVVVAPGRTLARRELAAAGAGR